MNDFILKLNTLNVGDIFLNEPMKNHTTYKVGGACKVMATPKTIDQLVTLMKLINEYQINYKVVGNGSNLLFSDHEYNGVIIKLNNIKHIEINDDLLVVGAGFMLPKLSITTARKGLLGLEFASGIPGTVGGAIFMNAGAYNMEMKDVVLRVHILKPNGELKWYTNEEMEFAYRHSMLHQNPELVVVEVEFQLNYGDAYEAIELINERKKRRVSSQPLEFPSAGSVFQNPHPYSSWQVIEDCGLRGFTVGGAMVSDKHTNFIVNHNNAKAQDIKELIEHIQKEVQKQKGIELHTEQEFVNWE